jgi:uncharacterized damage-inducible protein DinB
VSANPMLGRPERAETAPYYHGYIDRIASDDVLQALETQIGEATAFLESITEQKSRHRYAPDKWSIRQVLNHVNDAERVFAFRAFWFARGFDTALASFDEKPSAAAARADEFSWASHVEEFRAIRQGTLAFFRNLPPEAWMRKGTASGNPFTVKALAYIVAGHTAHHSAVLRERYL